MNNTFFRLFTSMEDYINKMSSDPNIVSIDELSTEAILAGNNAILQIRKVIENIKTQSYNAQTLLQIGILLADVSVNVRSMNEHFINNV